MFKVYLHAEHDFTHDPVCGFGMVICDADGSVCHINTVTNLDYIEDAELQDQHMIDKSLEHLEMLGIDDALIYCDSADAIFYGFRECDESRLRFKFLHANFNNLAKKACDENTHLRHLEQFHVSKGEFKPINEVEEPPVWEDC